MTKEIDNGFKVLHSDLQTAMLQEQSLHKKLNKTFIEQTQAIINSQSHITDAVHSQTKAIYKNTDRLVAENRRTREEITRLGRNMQAQVKQRGIGCNNLCKTTEGAMETVKTIGKKVVKGTICIATLFFVCD